MQSIASRLLTYHLSVKQSAPLDTFYLSLFFLVVISHLLQHYLFTYDVPHEGLPSIYVAANNIKVYSFIYKPLQ